jgi:hypothetical protein
MEQRERSGGITLNICGTPNPSPTLLNPDDLRGVSGSYAAKYFGKFFTNISSFTYGEWGWIFRTCNNGTWTDKETTEAAFVGGNKTAMGDITGTYIPCRPTTKDQCKKGLWETFGIFKNQGDCVSFVATGGKNLPAGH